MAVQQETPIGDEDLDALMAQLEEETVGMVAPPPAVVKKAAVVEEDDPLAGLDEDPKVFPATAPAGASKAPAVDELDPTDPRDTGATEPNIDDELAALEAEMSTSTKSSSNAVSGLDKIAVMANKTKEKYPSDMPKAASVTTAPDPVPEAAVARTDPEVIKPVKNLDDELADIAATMKPAGKVAAALPENPNPRPEEPKPATTGALAGLDFEIDVGQFRKDISVSETNLDNCMMEQAGLIAYYIEKAARAEAQAQRTKVQVEIGEAKLFDQHRKALAATAEKVTEKMVESAVRLDPKYGAIQNRLIEAESRAAIAKGCVEALKQRRDMIIQLGADRREEGKGAVRIMAAEQSHADLKARALAAAKRD